MWVDLAFPERPWSGPNVSRCPSLASGWKVVFSNELRPAARAQQRTTAGTLTRAGTLWPPNRLISCSRERARCAWLRVAPLLPSRPLRAAALAAPGRDGNAGSPIEQESGSCATAARTSRSPDRPPGGGIFWVAIAASHRAPIAKVTRLREHSGEAMPGPFGSISGCGNTATILIVALQWLS